MVKSVRAIFDGKVFKPEDPVDLKPNVRCVVTIESESEITVQSDEGTYPLTEIAKMATDMGVTNLSTRHSWYAHGRLENDGDAKQK